MWILKVKEGWKMVEVFRGHLNKAAELKKAYESMGIKVQLVLV